MPSLAFVTPAYPGRSISRTALLLASLREFGGELADSPVWILYPEALGDFSEPESTLLLDLDARLIPYEAEHALLNFPLGAKVKAAAGAEKLARGQIDILVWLDVDTLILSPPEEFILQNGKVLAYRPVHHQLLGTSWGEEPDEFWRMVYQHTGADPEKDFQMLTHAGERIRPYFNAGSYALRPERGILEGWWKNFQACYQAPEFKSFYDRNSLYAVFMHQAILTGTIQSLIGEDSLQTLSSSYNYPLHLHGDVPEDLRPKLIDEMVTLRYENLFDQPDWQDALPFSKELAGWIISRLDNFRTLGDQG
jgi:hypothetical protein